MTNRSWYLKLYPRKWRERYGEEFLAMLEQLEQLRMTDVLDIFISATKAHIEVKIQAPSKKEAVEPRIPTIDVGECSIQATAPTAKHNVATLTQNTITVKCMTCVKSFLIDATDHQYNKIRTRQTKFYFCKDCTHSLKTEAIHSSGIDPDQLDPFRLDKLVP